MERLKKFLIGLGIGLSIGIALIAFFSPVSGAEFQQNLRAHYQQALEAGRQASAAKRAELEAELAQLRQRNTTPTP